MFCNFLAVFCTQALCICSHGDFPFRNNLGFYSLFSLTETPFLNCEKVRERYFVPNIAINKLNFSKVISALRFVSFVSTKK